MRWLIGKLGVLGPEGPRFITRQEQSKKMFIIILELWAQGIRIIYNITFFGGIRWPLFYIKHFKVLINNLCAVDAYSTEHAIHIL